MSRRPLSPGCCLASVSLLFFAFAGPLLSADRGEMVGVAYYSPRAEDKPDADHIFAILQEHHIRAVTTASASAQINVAAAHAAEARQLIATTIEKEKLHVTLLRGR